MAANPSSLKLIAERMSKLAAARQLHLFPRPIAAAGSKSAVGAAATLIHSNFVTGKPFLVQSSPVSERILWSDRLFRDQVPIEAVNMTRFMENEKPIDDGAAKVDGSVRMEMKPSNQNKDEESDVDFDEDGDEIYGEDEEEDSDGFYDEDDEFGDGEGDDDEEEVERGRRKK